MAFEIGDQVVHPQHGVGHVVSLAEREFEPGVTRQYYEIFISGSTLWVSLDLPTLGLRKLTGKRQIARCREILASPPAPLDEDPRLRQSNLLARLKLGTIVAQCEVVRDLTAYCARKPMNTSIVSFLRMAQEVLAQEWAIVEDVPLADAVFEIGSLLDKSKLTISEAVE